MGLLNISAAKNINRVTEENNQSTLTFESKSGYGAIVYFDLETTGLSLSCDVLKIEMKCGNSVFNEYINPQQTINPKASVIHGLTNEEGQLHLHGKAMASVAP